MTVPVVAIVGRPNVGKSSLFNWLAGRRIAIVDPTAGVTRDRVSTLVQIGARFLELVDTGGMGIADVDNLTARDRTANRRWRIDQADVILFVVDGRAGILGRWTRKSRGGCATSTSRSCAWPTSATREALDPQAAEFYKLGFGKVVCVSAQQNRGIAPSCCTTSRIACPPSGNGW